MRLYLLQLKSCCRLSGMKNYSFAERKISVPPSVVVSRTTVSIGCAANPGPWGFSDLPHGKAATKSNGRVWEMLSLDFGRRTSEVPATFSVAPLFAVR